MLPATVIGGLGIAYGWPIPLIFAAYFFMGMAIGFVSTAGLTLLQSAAAASEMGRATVPTSSSGRCRSRTGSPSAERSSSSS